MSNTKMTDVLNNIETMAAGDQLPLATVFLQCFDKEHLSPENDYTAWDQCLIKVYGVRDPKPTVKEFGDAMYTVWKDVGLSREIMIKALKSITDFMDASIYTEVNNYYPITVLMTVDTTKTVQSGDLSNNIKITDDNGDPSQGSNEITVNAKVSNTLVWKAVSVNGTDVVHLKGFVHRAQSHLFPQNEPSLQADGTFKGTLSLAGKETYSFTITINDGTKEYNWDPFINCTN